MEEDMIRTEKMNMSPQTAPITQSNIHIWKPALEPIKERIEKFVSELS